MKRTFWQWLLGYKYILNTRSMEIHRISTVTGACHIKNMSAKNKMMLTEEQCLDMLWNGGDDVNGCCHCFKEASKD